MLLRADSGGNSGNRASALTTLYALTASRRAFAALNDGVVEAAMATGSPVWGFRPYSGIRLIPASAWIV